MITGTISDIDYDEIRTILKNNSVEVKKVELHYENNDFGEKLAINLLSNSDYLKVIDAINKDLIVETILSSLFITPFLAILIRFNLQLK